jgi:hypothetical protein
MNQVRHSYGLYNRIGLPCCFGFVASYIHELGSIRGVVRAARNRRRLLCLPSWGYRRRGRLLEGVEVWLPRRIGSISQRAVLAYLSCWLLRN